MIKKMLVGYIQDGKHSGIDKYLLGFIKVAHENGVVIDLLTAEVTSEMSAYLSKFGYGLFAVPSLKKPLARYKAIKGIIKKGCYDGTYFNISESFNCMGLLAAKKCGIPVRIVHSHSSGVDRTNKYVRIARETLHKLFRHRVSSLATQRLACSSVAGKWMFDKDFNIIYNAVDKSRFLYNETLRQNMRNTLGLTDEKVFIHIGNFCYAKNSFFLVDIMKQVLNQYKNAVLLSVGTGPDFEAVCEYAKKLKVDKNIRFLGVRDDIPALLSAADVFIFPSRFEGLSITCIEAQFSGLPCVLSKNISSEVKISKDVYFLPIDSTDGWADTALALCKERKSARLNDEVAKNYDIINQQYQIKSILEV